MHIETHQPSRLTRQVTEVAVVLAAIQFAKLLRTTAPLLLCLLVSAFAASPAQAQLFGARTVGSPLGPASAQGSNVAGANVGTLTGNERFLRGNRSRRDFVGSSRSDQTGFVGAGQAIGVGRVPSATDGLRIETSDSNRINRPIPAQSTKGMYYPRLEIGFDIKHSTSISAAELAADERLLERVVNVTGNQAQLTLDGRTAILRGTVKSAHDAKLAEQLLSFEPGIDRVQNELEIAL